MQLRAVVLADYPHDPRAYTQGLEWFEGRLYESTGLYGRSSVREVDLYTGEVLRRRELPDYLFGEGLARVGDQLVQLTWKAGLGRVLGLGDFAERRQFRYSGEGWGLCFDGERLVMSDGTAELRFLDAETFAELGRVEVHVEGHPLRNVNELECVGGQVYANLLGADALVRIDPTSGRVTALIEASGLLQGSDTAGSEVLNGIAYNPRDEVFYLTGKLWPRLFEVRFEPAD